MKKAVHAGLLLFSSFVVVGSFSPFPCSLPLSSRRLPTHQRCHVRMLFAMPKDIKNGISVGDVVVPVLKTGKLRGRLASIGVYPGIEYRVLNMTISDTTNGVGEELGVKIPVTCVDSINNQQRDDVTVSLAPIYRLAKNYERQWPAIISFQELPTLLSTPMYNTVTLLGTLFLSFSFLMMGLIGRNLVQFVVIPSLSMQPTLQVGDVLLVERFSTHFQGPRRGEIVVFAPPPALQKVVEQRGGTLNERDVFVKRVGCISEDVVHLRNEHLWCETKEKGLIEPPSVHTSTISLPVAAAAGEIPPARKQDLKVPSNSAFVVGDNPEVSLDSRVWGTLPDGNIVGRPMFRLLPLHRFGRIE